MYSHKYNIYTCSYAQNSFFLSARIKLPATQRLIVQGPCFDWPAALWMHTFIRLMTSNMTDKYFVATKQDILQSH